MLRPKNSYFEVHDYKMASSEKEYTVRKNRIYLDTLKENKHWDIGLQHFEKKVERLTEDEYKLDYVDEDRLRRLVERS